MKQVQKILCGILAVGLVLGLGGCKHTDEDFAAAKELFVQEEYAKARAAFKELGDYENAADLVKECDYRMAMGHYEAEEYEEAAIAFRAIGKYKQSQALAKNCEYQLARDLYDSGDYARAVKELSSLGDYKNSAALVALASDGLLLDKLAGDWVYTVDRTEEYRAAVAKALEEAEMESIGKNLELGELSQTMVMTIGEEGYFVSKPQKVDVRKLTEDLREVLKNAVDAYFMAIVEYDAEDQELTVEELYEQVGVESMEEYIAYDRDIELDEAFVEKLIPKEFLESLSDEESSVGICRVSGGEITFATLQSVLQGQLGEDENTLRLAEKNEETGLVTDRVFTRKM